MIWYLLYPFRGTTEAPVLSPTHPLRDACTRYGRYAARHVISTLLLSVTVASILIYPFPFLYTNDFTNGASNLPHHVWTDAQPLEDKGGLEPDVMMRYIWVHGDYMRALDQDVLHGALELQNELLGPTIDFSPRQLPRPLETVDFSRTTALDLNPRQRDSFHIANGLTDESWFFHSPLLYWSCDENKLAADKDIIATVNNKKTQHTSVNVTLRHSIVFSGKRFEDRKLAAADALVITLIHRRNSPIGRIWQAKCEELARKMADKWDIYPSDGTSMRSQIYEFQFRPMSVQDGLALGAAYLLVALYFVVSLTKLRAVKSKIGLVVTVMAQLILSILSSFTVCAVFKIDLSRIPQLAYPVAIFSMSLENIFRLINAVILTTPEDSTSNRIGHAFGTTGHIALASVGQNLFILWGLSYVVSPGVQAFCTFAAIAIIFDFFYLSTFFLSVLSVDVRRTELSDALAKASIRNHRTPAEAKAGQTWLEALLQGKIAMSTRIAGTIVMVGFVLIAQWHFFDMSLLHLIGLITMLSKRYTDTGPKSSLLIDIHQARSPTSWLRLQDHETAREVINVVKPDAHSYVARVFDPIVFVKKGADRMLSTSERRFLPAVYDFVRHQTLPFVVTVLTIAAAVRILMNYLLYDELAESPSVGVEEEPLLTVQTLGKGHSLDVVALSASPDGHVVSVGLDRIIRVWDVKAGGSYALMGNDQVKIVFPILAMCIDDDSRYLALLMTRTVVMWDLQECRWGPSTAIEPFRHRPEAFFFAAQESEGVHPVLLLRRDGTMTEIKPEKGETESYLITDGTLVSVGALVEQAKATTKVMTSTRDGQVHCLSQEASGWDCNTVDIPRPRDKEFMSLVALPELGFILVVRVQSIDLVHAETYTSIHSFRTDPIQPKTLKCFHSKRRTMRCGSVGLKYLTFAYLNAFTRDLVVQTYMPQDEGASICFRAPGLPVSKTCCRWPETKEMRSVVKDPGTWEALPSRILLGVRKKSIPKTRLENGHAHQNGNGELRRRRSSHTQAPTPNIRNQDMWEIWMLSQAGNVETWDTMPLCRDTDEAEHLYVNTTGPMVRVGRGSVAIGLSNVIKVILVGHERFEGGEESSALEDGLGTVMNRRRNKPSTLRGKPPVVLS
ncbi:sterol-sensing domain of SREBP cleavage-activation-domain-containing protein [Truncatella angustata]|uniref:Sterol regulatory element-binding protein cleavage-activating protein n=1 Tax=Truncatella angustata TaxID=152316 RepID=A0A9P8ZUK1_9PEZI|nr:sterol-sensing domain of SREBP cleavage-activation-domain-containing protein [Truncatella angustata]KAH6649146.1 sterol-sensing domain of SREBP cleavage-activation-domain-containing protein [Truncatella angustata]